MEAPSGEQQAAATPSGSASVKHQGASARKAGGDQAAANPAAVPLACDWGTKDQISSTPDGLQTTKFSIKLEPGQQQQQLLQCQQQEEEWQAQEQQHSGGAYACAEPMQWAAKQHTSAVEQEGAEGDTAAGQGPETSSGQPYAVMSPRAKPEEGHAGVPQQPHRAQPQQRHAEARQLQLRDAIFAGVMEPAPASGSGLGGLPQLSPTPLIDPLMLLRASMLNADPPGGSPPSAGGAGASGRLAAATGRADAAGGDGSGGAGPEGGDEGGGWQRRQRISAVIREELAEVAKALEAGLPQVSRQLRRQTSLPALRGPDDSRQMSQLIPTPSGPPSGAATPGVSSPMIGGALAAPGPGANGHSSNVGYRSAWQQQQQQQQQVQPLRPSLLQDVPGTPGTMRRVKRPADLAAEQLAASVLAAHKGNWVSALHKLASAVGRQLQSARETAAASSAGGGAGTGTCDTADQQSQQPQLAAAGQLPEPEIAAREARLKRVLVKGTHAARAVAGYGPAPMGGVQAAVPIAVGIGLHHHHHQQQQQQHHPHLHQRHAPSEQRMYEYQEQQPAAAGAPSAQRQLQLGMLDEPMGGGPTAHVAMGATPPVDAAGVGDDGVDAAAACVLPQAWGSGVTMPHMRPRPGPSRLAHQSSMQQAWSGVFEEEFAAAELAACQARINGAAGANAVGLQHQEPPGAAAALQDPVLQLQHLQLQHAKLAMLGVPPPGAGIAPSAAASAAGAAAAAAAALQRHAAHLVEPIISLRDARREARSRSATPGVRTPRAGTPAAGAPAPRTMLPVASKGGVAAMDVDEHERPGVGPEARGAGCHHYDEEDEDHDPIAARLAAAEAAAAGGAAGDLDLGPDLDDLELVGHEAAAAAAVAAMIGAAGPVQLAPQLQLLPHTQPPHHPAAHLAQLQPQMLQQPHQAHLQPMDMALESGTISFGVQQPPGQPHQ